MFSRFLVCGVIALSFLLNAIPADAQTASASPQIEMHRQQVGGGEDQGWRIANSTQGGFSVELPIAFNDFVVRGTDANIGAFAVHTVGGRSPGGAKLTATLMPVTERMKKPDLKSIAESFRKPGAAFTNFSETKTELGEEITFRVSSSSNIAAMRYVLTTRGLFTLIVDWPANESATAEKWVERFLSSLKFDPKVKQ